MITFNKESADNSQEAREHAENVIINEGFTGSDGRWSHGIADWFVIGGRRSGELSRHSWAKHITGQMRAIEKKQNVSVGAFYGDEAKKKLQVELLTQFTQMWQEAAPPEYKDIPYQRDTYKNDGYADDAMILTQEIYDGLLKQYEGREDSEHHADLDFEPVAPDMIGRKWIVVVDYHS
jgi:hypothetical protein